MHPLRLLNFNSLKLKDENVAKRESLQWMKWNNKVINQNVILPINISLLNETIVTSEHSLSKTQIKQK